MKKGLARRTIMLIGDWAGLYLALFLLTLIRYGADWEVNWNNHFRPFTLIFPLWIVTLYGSYLYETRFLRPALDFLRVMGTAIFISLVGSMSAFYLFPPGLIHPRRNLVIFALLFGLVLLIWRYLFYRTSRLWIKSRVRFIGDGPEVTELTKHFKDNPELGYINEGTIKEIPKDLDSVAEQAKSDGVNLIVVKSPQRLRSSKSLMPLVSSGISVMELEEFYERTFNKVSPEMLDDTWFIKSLENLNAEVYQTAKRIIDIATGLLGMAFLVLSFIPIAIATKFDSRGPVIFKQDRIGKNGVLFKIYKFRSMESVAPDGSAEKRGAKWAKKNDQRVTRVGRFLRNTRLDELPQFWNILKGDLSLVGPRPERPEFVKELSEAIPYYDTRHLVKPGLTGWAQISYKYGSSVKDARVKLQYDIYYAKKKSIILDAAIVLKTIKIVLTGQGV